MKEHFLRLHPGEDLSVALESFRSARGIEAGAIVFGLGSLAEVSLRFAGSKESTRWSGDHEIVALSGTFSREGNHVHLAVSDATGVTRGGHLMSGCRVRTTAEIGILQFLEWKFGRETDLRTGYREWIFQKL